jgi:ABC transport system ATP-binding/permease protein
MDLRSYLELFLFDGQKQRQKVGSLSGGERARVALAKVLREGANLLMFDEPTNDLDLPTLAALEEMLTGYEGSVIVVTHDRAFLDRVATAILAFEVDPNGSGLARVVRYAGGYEDYIAQRGDRSSSKKATPKVESGAPTTADKSGKTPKAGLTRAEKVELETLVDAVDAADKRVAEVEALLADPSLYVERGHEVAGLKARLEAARGDAARLAARWEALEARR